LVCAIGSVHQEVGREIRVLGGKPESYGLESNLIRDFKVVIE
jgi:hypothetical protein